MPFTYHPHLAVAFHAWVGNPSPHTSRFIEAAGSRPGDQEGRFYPLPANEGAHQAVFAPMASRFNNRTGLLIH